MITEAMSQADADQLLRWMDQMSSAQLGLLWRFVTFYHMTHAQERYTKERREHEQKTAHDLHSQESRRAAGSD